MTTIRCDRPQGCASGDAGSDWVQVDFPDRAPLFFCGFNCLHTWAMYWGTAPSRDGLRTRFIEPRPLEAS